jgi:hypothetical protein
MSSYLTAEEFSALMTHEVDPQPDNAVKPHLVAVETPVQTEKVTEVARAQPVDQVAIPTGPCNTTEVHDPAAKPTTGLNLRLNDYQIELIRQLAAREERSMQQVIRRTLIPAIEQALRCDN